MTNWSGNKLSLLAGVTNNIPERKLLPPPTTHFLRPSPKDATPVTEEAAQGPNILSDRSLNLDLDVENTLEEKKEEVEAREKAIASQKEELSRLAALPEEDFGMEWDVIYEGDELPLLKKEEEEVIYEEAELGEEEKNGAKYQIVADIEYVEAYPGQVFPQTVYRSGAGEGFYNQEQSNDPYLNQQWDHENEDQLAQADSKETDIEDNLDDIKAGNFVDRWENKNFPSSTGLNIPGREPVADLNIEYQDFYQDQHSREVISDQVIESPVEPPKHLNYVDSLESEYDEIGYPLYDDIVTYPSADMIQQAAPYQGNLLGTESMQVVLVQSYPVDQEEGLHLLDQRMGEGRPVGQKTHLIGVEEKKMADPRKFLAAGGKISGKDYHPPEFLDCQTNLIFSILNF